MPGLVIHTANHLAPLLDTLALALSRAPLPPVDEEIIVVQSQGMRRWLTLGLARALGCAASLSMPFPSAFCHWLAERAGGEDTGNSLRPFDRSVLLWRLLAGVDRRGRVRGECELCHLVSSVWHSPTVVSHRLYEL